MAGLATKGYKATIFDDLAPFATMIVDQSKGVSLSELNFTSAQDHFSTASTQPATRTIGANNELRLFTNNVGEAGQGLVQPATLQQTNNTNGDKMPSNQVYIGLKTGFQIYYMDNPNANTIARFIDGADDLLGLGLGYVWSLNVGDGIKRNIGCVLDYPSGSGVWGFPVSAAGSSSTAAPTFEFQQNGGPLTPMRPLPLPVVWPPNIKVDIRLTCGNAIILTGQGTSDAICFRQTFRGYMMTLPV